LSAPHGSGIERPRGAISVTGGLPIRIAIEPPLARLCGRDHGMTCDLGMPRRVPVRRAVAAVRSAARLAGTKVNPGIARLHAFVTLVTLLLLDSRDLRQVTATRCVGHG